MNTPHFLRSSILALSFGLLGLAARRADAQTVITSVPYTITASGHYKINGNLASTNASVPAITIAAANVILDLNGFFVSGPGNTAGSYSDPSQSVIEVNDVANVTIRNGTLAGSAFGISFNSSTAANSRNYIVESVVITRCYVYGIWFPHSLAAPGSVFRDCSVSYLGGSTYTTNVTIAGFYTSGGVRMETNTFGNLTATGNGGTYGIFGSASDFAIGNTISGCTVGINNTTFLNNLTDSCTTPFMDGVNATGNQ